jgi:hypothetical protein
MEAVKGARIIGTAIMNEVSLAAQQRIASVDGIARDLCPPKGIGIGGASPAQHRFSSCQTSATFFDSDFLPQNRVYKTRVS